MIIKVILKVAIVAFIAALLYSCKKGNPKTEKECLIEAKYILSIVQKDDYAEKLSFLGKYKKYSNHYSEADYTKAYKRLHEYLKGVKLDSLKIETKRDSMSLNFDGLNSTVSYFEILFYRISPEINKEAEVCSLSYSKAIDEKDYTLSLFQHNLEPKHIPVVPSAPPKLQR